MVPVIAGFEREEKEKVLRAFPTAEYCIYELECTAEQKAEIRETLRKDYERRFHFHYAVLGLLFILLQRPFYQKNHFTCSSYIAKLLEENQILIADRHFSLVTPRDFMAYGEKRVIFEGSLREFISRCDPGFFSLYGSAGFPAKYPSRYPSRYPAESPAKYPAESAAKSPAKYLLASSGERWYSEQCRQLPEYQKYDGEAVYER